MPTYDVAIIGLGHAGVEAALAASRLGARVVAVTQAPDRIGLMSCNPAVGGPGKSQLVREIDALGGAMGAAANQTALQARVLNRSKGPASWATRMQVDRGRYAAAIRASILESDIDLVAGEASALRHRHGVLDGIVVGGEALSCRAAVLTTGTFLAARMHVGGEQRAGGRAGDRASEDLALGLRELGLALVRFKTGTPPRLEGASIDWSQCEEQPSELPRHTLSRRTAGFPLLPQRSSFITRTNAETHAIVAQALARSPLTSGAISGRGPRYCPSLEQKVLHYPEKRGHLVYLEPDGLDTTEIYPAGLSTSLPLDAQLALLRSIPGLARVEIHRPGYAVEYDAIAPGQLRPTLALPGPQGLFAAGQINGSSGYEEAAAQGLVAGVNAVRFVRGQTPWVPERTNSFLGVLIDDLVSGRFDEPYRILPSRAEHRLWLREDNAEHRLAAVGAELGLIPPEVAARWAKQRAQVDETVRGLSVALRAELRRPELALEEALAGPPLAGLERDLAEQVFLHTRYEPYLEQRETAATRLQGELGRAIPERFPFERLIGLSGEAREVLARHRPRSVGEALKLPGVSSEAAAILVARLRRMDADVPRGTDGA